MSETTRFQALVSVIVTVYNCEPYISDALESIIHQTYSNLEIVVVDDCSTDASWEIIQLYASRDERIKAFRNSLNQRQTRSRNFAIRQSTGSFLTQLDGDDVRTLDSIAKQMRFLAQHPDIIAVGGAAEICDSHMNRLNDRFYPTDDATIRRAFFRYSPFCQSSLLIRRDFVGEDPYKIEMEPSEDIDLSLRLGAAGQLANLSEVIYRIRTHERSVTRTMTRSMETKTLYLRVKAAFEYGYDITFADKLYMAAQLATMYVMPLSFRFWLFNKTRSYRR